MIITHETTIEEYEYWLATNPEFSDFKKAVRATFRVVHRTLSRIGRLIRKAKNGAACTSGRLVERSVFPICYDRNAGFTTARYHNWLLAISLELCATRQHIKRLKMFDILEGKAWAAGIFDQKQERMARIEEGLGVEHALEGALEILNNTTN